MNFTKPGITGGKGYDSKALFQRVMFKSRREGNSEWSSIGSEKLEYVKTRVARRKKDALAAAADSDQDDWVEEAFAQDEKDKDGPKKMKRQFYYYALTFEVDFQYDKDTVYFAFSQPYPYT